MSEPMKLPNLPAGSEVANYLYSDLELEERHQDLLTLNLPSGVSISVGWFPEFSAAGEYWVRANWENGEIAPIRTKSFAKVQEFVRSLVDYHAREFRLTSASTFSQSSKYSLAN